MNKKKINKEKNKVNIKNIVKGKYIFYFLLWLSATYVFFQYKMIILTDSKYYYLMSKCLTGVISFSLWHPIRGFSYPLIIAIFTKLFGDNQVGLLIGSYLVYLAFNILFLILLNKFLNINNIKRKWIYYFLYADLVVFNTLIIGFTHTVMTESVMPLFYLISFYLCLKWYNLNLDSKLKNIVFSIIFALLGIFIWFIKQPYIIAYLTMLLITCFASALKQKKFKTFLIKFSTFCIAIICLFLSIKGWDKILVVKESSPSSVADQNYMNDIFSGGTKFYFQGITKNEYCNDSYIFDLDIPEKSKNRLREYMKFNSEGWCDHIRLYKIVKKDEIKGYEFYIFGGNQFTTYDSTFLLIKNLVKRPLYVLGSYYHNYLALANIEGTDSRYKSDGKLTSWQYDGFEFRKDGLYIYYSGSTLAYIDMHDVPIEADPIVNYKDKTQDRGILTKVLLANYKIIINLFKVLMFVLLPLFIYSVIKFIKSKDINYFMICLISGATFANNIFQVFMGAIIDRYAYPLFPSMILCFLLILMLVSKKFRRSGKDEK